MTLSLLMYSLMVSTFVALVCILAVDALRSRLKRSRPVRVAAPMPRYARGRVQHRWDCPQPTDASSTARKRTRSTALPRRRATPSSCRR
jgi:hypothetical protein